MVELLDLPRAELLARAAAVRDETWGTRVTYSPKVFIPLTMLCQDRCGYCTFARPPARLDDPFLDPDQVLEIARAGQAAGCHEALFTLGERPELRYPVAAEVVEASDAAEGVAQDQDRPAIAEDLERPGDRACRRVVAPLGLHRAQPR